MRLKDPILKLEMDDARMIPGRYLVLDVLEVINLSVSTKYSEMGIKEFSEVTLQLLVNKATIYLSGVFNEEDKPKVLKGRKLMLLEEVGENENGEDMS